MGPVSGRAVPFAVPCPVGPCRAGILDRNFWPEFLASWHFKGLLHPYRSRGRKPPTPVWVVKGPTLVSYLVPVHVSDLGPSCFGPTVRPDAQVASEGCEGLES